MAKIRESKMRYGSFSWKCQQEMEPITGRPVTAKENLKMVYDGKVPYWLPVWMHDFQWIWPDVIEEHPKYDADGKDWFGAEWVYVEEVGGSMVKPGTRLLSEFLKWREELKFPDLDAVDWASDAAYQKEIYDPDRLHLFQTTEGLFERLHEIIPFEEALEALIEEPEEVEEFFKAVADYKIEVLSKIFEHYEPIDIVTYSDDWGTQRAGFFSLPMFQNLIKPQTRRIIEFIKSKGKYVELHSCGMCQQYVPDFIDMGINSWTPQECNDLEMLKKQFGDKITFNMPIQGLDNPNITEEEARRLTREFVDKFAGRGNVLATVGMCTPEIHRAVLDELYTYSSEHYARLR